MAVKTLDATNDIHQETLLRPQMTGARATYKAKGYLAAYISACYGASDPVLVQLDRLVWQVLIHFKTPHERSLRVGFLNIDTELPNSLIIRFDI